MRLMDCGKVGHAWKLCLFKLHRPISRSCAAEACSHLCNRQVICKRAADPPLSANGIVLCGQPARRHFTSQTAHQGTCICRCRSSDGLTSQDKFKNDESFIAEIMITLPSQQLMGIAKMALQTIWLTWQHAKG